MLVGRDHFLAIFRTVLVDKFFFISDGLLSDFINLNVLTKTTIV